VSRGQQWEDLICLTIKQS